MNIYIGLFTQCLFVGIYCHMHSDCFNPYKDYCNLITYVLQGSPLLAFGNLNYSKNYLLQTF